MSRTLRRLVLPFTVVMVLALVLVACAAPAAPTPTAAPKQAAPAATPTTAPKPAQAAPTAAATASAPKPAATPAAAAPAKPTGKPIKLGSMLPQTGGLASIGKQIEIAYKLAVDEINKSGGVNGSPVELVAMDTRGDPKEGVTVIRKLVTQDKVAAVVGPFTSSEFNVTAPVANELKVPNMSLAAQFGIASKNRPWAFQSVTQSPVWWPSGIEAFKKKYPNVKKLAMVRDIKYAASEYEGRELLPKLLKDAGLELVGAVDFETGNKDWSVIAAKIKDLNADGLVATGVYVDTPGLLKELERIGYQAKVMISPTFFSVNVLWSSPKFLEGAVIPYWVDWTRSDPKLQAMVKSWQDEVAKDSSMPKAPAGAYNWYPSHEVAGYDSVIAIADVMRKGGVNGDTAIEQARDKVRTGYEGLKSWPGLVGNITVDGPAGDVKWATPVFIIENGVPKRIN